VAAVHRRGDRRRVDGRVQPPAQGSHADLKRRGDGIADRQTGSTWDITGRAIAGSLEGKRLRAVRHDQQFWFSLAAFLSDAQIVSTPR